MSRSSTVNVLRTLADEWAVRAEAAFREAEFHQEQGDAQRHENLIRVGDCLVRRAAELRRKADKLEAAEGEGVTGWITGPRPSDT